MSIFHMDTVFDSAPEPEGPVPKGEPTPYATPEMGAVLLTPGVDEFYEEEAYVWCRLAQTDGDWEIEVGGDEFIGPVPDWWGRDIGEGDCGLGVQWMLCNSHSHFGEVMDWALREGLSPGQEFAVYCSRPEWYRCSWEYEEYDFDNDLYVIRREPPPISLRDFERAVTEVFEEIRACNRLRESNERARWAEDRRMYLCWRYGGGWGYNCDPWCSVELCSNLHDVDRPEATCHHRLASGRSDKNSREEAMAKLKAVVAERRPDLDLDSLPARRW